MFSDNGDSLLGLITVFVDLENISIIQTDRQAGLWWTDLHGIESLNAFVCNRSLSTEVLKGVLVGI
jgi:hypothetical protein